MRLDIEHELDEIFESGEYSEHIDLITIHELALVIQTTKKKHGEERHYHAFSDIDEAMEWLDKNGFDFYNTLS